MVWEVRVPVRVPPERGRYEPLLLPGAFAKGNNDI
jgi:hypothetical protein